MRCLWQMKKRLLPVRSIRTARLQNDWGFSLPELLIVLFCLSIVFTVAVPVYQSVVADRQLRSAANQLVADLAECRSVANLTGTPCSIGFVHDNRYLVSGPERQREVMLPTGVRFSERKLPFNRQVIQFNENGHPAGGGSVTLQNRLGKQRVITIYLHSGQIKLEEARGSK
ncbi:GspH/FimT family pseudopilin [Effusibacillus dendaii]|uniref:General secretion pathway GspH domain-containing protein n=1 Tax=Effusibacillus dendaii TaxID=2743772 RepID=A0A7I8DAL5_9BACL|nr:GspH/FimT family pseudopilin [Effusibacillus dendaii]BCJ85999.1 hypothetical protein skT53_09840 [Effusibacillus dendaii]